jgi:hypothetical protein
VDEHNLITSWGSLCITAKFAGDWQQRVDGVEKGLVIFGEQ